MLRGVHDVPNGLMTRKMHIGRARHISTTLEAIPRPPYSPIACFTHYGLSRSAQAHLDRPYSPFHAPGFARMSPRPHRPRWAFSSRGLVLDEAEMVHRTIHSITRRPWRVSTASTGCSMRTTRHYRTVLIAARLVASSSPQATPSITSLSGTRLHGPSDHYIAISPILASIPGLDGSFDAPTA